MRVSFLVDGFDLYHSRRHAEATRRDGGYRWLDLRSLLASYLGHVDRGAFLGEIAYFSAIGTHLQKASHGTVQRHRTYIEALRTIGVRIELGHFKRSRRTCPACGAPSFRHEEKQTRRRDRRDPGRVGGNWLLRCRMLVSGDSDLVPAVRIAKRLAPDLRVGVIQPPSSNPATVWESGRESHEGQ